MVGCRQPAALIRETGRPVGRRRPAPLFVNGKVIMPAPQALTLPVSVINYPVNG